MNSWSGRHRNRIRQGAGSDPSYHKGKRRAAVLLTAAALFGAISWPAAGMEGPMAPVQGTPDSAAQPGSSANAAIPMLDTIRVALFAETPRFRSITSKVTLTSEAGLTVGLRSAEGLVPLFTAAPKAPVRIGDANGYSVRLLESADAEQAKALVRKIAAGGETAALVSRSRKGQTVYQVVAGPYGSLTEAQSAGQKWAGSGAGTPAVMGPLRLSAGSFPSEAAAAAQAAVVAQAGFDADVAVQIASQGQAPAYTVMVGHAVDAGALQTLKTQLAAAVPAVAFATVPADASYALKRTEQTMAGESLVASAAFAVGGGSGVKLWAAPASPDSGVTVQERFGRGYRGGIEVSRHNNRLAVINEVPLESYLYSVVGTELGVQWPLEALKAQAVASRTYALKQGVKHEIAHVSDTTIDQAYKGTEAEFPAAIDAVRQTAGEVLADRSGLIEPLFGSNAGGLTAEPTEVWGNAVDYLKSAASPDEAAQEGKLPWYRIVLPGGETGYIRSDYARSTGETNAAGLPYYSPTEGGVNVRSAPYVDNAGNPSIAQVQLGDRFVVIGSVAESTAYTWIRGPYTASSLKERLNADPAGAVQGALERFEVTKYGPSGRVLELSANGVPLKPAYPDAYRSLLGGLPSTRFEIEETGSYTILGANGTVRKQTPSLSKPYVLSSRTSTAAGQNGTMFVLGADGEVRVVTPDAQFVFHGAGYGHGLGLSQWGAKGLAEQGYDYRQILQTYYHGVSIIKG